MEVCPACEHSIGEHIQSVDGKVRCWHVDSGTSTSGVLGMPWSQRCDCVDYKSVFAEQEQAERRREEQNVEDACSEIRRAFLEKLEKEKLEKS